MTDKRFTYEYDEYEGNLFDNKYNTFYPIDDSEVNLELLCDRLNNLHEENKIFREALQELKEIGDYQAMTINELHEKNKELRLFVDTLKKQNMKFKL